MKKEKKVDYLSNEFLNPIIKIGILFYGVYLIFNWLFGSTFFAYKCDYKSALFGTVEETISILNEFGGDPCEKKGKNRFKSKLKEFKSKEECENYINYGKGLSSSDRYVLLCEKD